jgi:hypothetical protein
MSPESRFMANIAGKVTERIYPKDFHAIRKNSIRARLDPSLCLFPNEFSELYCGEKRAF